MTMTNLGKRTNKAREGIDREKLYSIDDAVKMIKDRAKAKFDETIEISMNLGVDPRHADQMVRGVCNLPNGSGRTVRVAVEVRVEKAGIVHAGIGKASFDDGKLVENIKAFADAVSKAKPSGAKGTYIQRVAVSSTMGPGVKVDPSSVIGG